MVPGHVGPGYKLRLFKDLEMNSLCYAAARDRATKPFRVFRAFRGSKFFKAPIEATP